MWGGAWGVESLEVGVGVGRSKECGVRGAEVELTLPSLIGSHPKGTCAASDAGAWGCVLTGTGPRPVCVQL